MWFPDIPGIQAVDPLDRSAQVSSCADYREGVSDGYPRLFLLKRIGTAFTFTITLPVFVSREACVCVFVYYVGMMLKSIAIPIKTV